MEALKNRIDTIEMDISDTMRSKRSEMTTVIVDNALRIANDSTPAISNMTQSSHAIVRRDVCWYCGGRLSWNSDFNYDEVFGEGEGIVSHLTCSNCGAEVQYSLLD